MKNQKPTIKKLAREEHAGDWHDKPLRWLVTGMKWGNQKFSTKKEATIYASCYRRTATYNECFAMWMAKETA